MMDTLLHTTMNVVLSRTVRVAGIKEETMLMVSGKSRCCYGGGATLSQQSAWYTPLKTASHQKARSLGFS